MQAQRTLVEVPVSMTDGRQRQLKVVQGDQHDLPNLVANFLEAMLVPESAGVQLLQVVEQRLPKVRTRAQVKVSYTLYKPSTIEWVARPQKVKLVRCSVSVLRCDVCL